MCFTNTLEQLVCREVTRDMKIFLRIRIVVQRHFGSSRADLVEMTDRILRS